MRYALGLDNGGTMIKAAVYDETGCEIACASCPTETINPVSGFVERDMQVMWEANCSCIRRVLEKSNIPAEQIIAVSVAGHGKGLYLWGEGKPLCNAILSSDNRAWSYPEKWKADGTWDALYPKLRQPLLAGQPVALLAWLKEHEASTYQSIQWVFSAKDYIRFRLSGKACSEITDISGSGMMDIENGCVNADLLKALGIEEIYSRIPPLCGSCDICGSISAETAALTGLQEGTPVAGGMFDIDACAIAMNITSPDYICSISGTWSINELLSKQPVTSSTSVLHSRYAIPEYYLIEESSATGAGNADWILEHLIHLPSDDSRYETANQMVSEILPEHCDVYYLPFLYGSSGHPLGKACFAGMTSYHDERHMLRAVYEGVVFCAKDHMEHLLQLRPAVKAVRLGGGAAKSAVWIQLFADILNQPIETVSGVKELGAFGCAMAGFVAAGVYRDYEEAAAAMVKLNDAVYPDPHRVEIYEKKYEKYSALRKAMDTVWPLFTV